VFLITFPLGLNATLIVVSFGCNVNFSNTVMLEPTKIVLGCICTVVCYFVLSCNVRTKIVLGFL
jgi:hypothetical protein